MSPLTSKLRSEQLEPRLMLSRATPTLTTAAFFRQGSSTSLTAIVGQAIPEDSAVLSGGNRPTDGILFRLSAPDGSIVATQWVNVHGNDTYRTSCTVIAQQVGTYTWHARYYGDRRNNSVNDQGGPAESLAVLAVPPVVPPPVTQPPVVTAKPHGYQTFYETASQDRALPSTQAYYRYDWSQIEPVYGQYNFSAIEADLATAEAAGQQFNFRIMPYEDGGGGPVALKNAGLPGSTFSFNGATTFQPNLDSPAVQADLDKLLAALGAAVGSQTATVDVGWWGSYGEWTNWGTSPAIARPSTAATEWLISETEKYFPHSYTIVQASMATDDPAAFHFAMTAGCGWRGDSWGNWSLHGEWADQNNVYPAAIAAAPDQWKRAPVILEPAGVFANWLTNGQPWQKSFDWAINTAHAWMFSNKSSGPIPSVMQSAVNQLLAAEAIL